MKTQLPVIAARPDKDKFPKIWALRMTHILGILFYVVSLKVLKCI